MLRLLSLPVRRAATVRAVHPRVFARVMCKEAAPEVDKEQFDKTMDIMSDEFYHEFFLREQMERNEEEYPTQKDAREELLLNNDVLRKMELMHNNGTMWEDPVVIPELKDEMYALHKTNPEYWDETRLSQAFQMRKINVRANLILKEREDKLRSEGVPLFDDTADYMQELSYGYVAPEAFKGWDHVDKHFQLVRKQYRDYLDSEAAEEVETKIDHEQQFREINEPTFSPRSLSLPFPLLPLEAPSGVEGVATEVDPRKEELEDQWEAGQPEGVSKEVPESVFETEELAGGKYVFPWESDKWKKFAKAQGFPVHENVSEGIEELEFEIVSANEPEHEDFHYKKFEVTEGANNGDDWEMHAHYMRGVDARKHIHPLTGEEVLLPPHYPASYNELMRPHVDPAEVIKKLDELEEKGRLEAFARIVGIREGWLPEKDKEFDDMLSKDDIETRAEGEEVESVAWDEEMETIYAQLKNFPKAKEDLQTAALRAESNCDTGLHEPVITGAADAEDEADRRSAAWGDMYDSTAYQEDDANDDGEQPNTARGLLEDAVVHYNAMGPRDQIMALAGLRDIHQYRFPHQLFEETFDIDEAGYDTTYAWERIYDQSFNQEEEEAHEQDKAAWELEREMKLGDKPDTLADYEDGNRDDFEAEELVEAYGHLFGEKVSKEEMQRQIDLMRTEKSTFDRADLVDYMVSFVPDAENREKWRALMRQISQTRLMDENDLKTMGVEVNDKWREWLEQFNDFVSQAPPDGRDMMDPFAKHGEHGEHDQLGDEDSDQDAERATDDEGEEEGLLRRMTEAQQESDSDAEEYPHGEFEPYEPGRPWDPRMELNESSGGPHYTFVDETIDHRAVARSLRPKRVSEDGNLPQAVPEQYKDREGAQLSDAMRDHDSWKSEVMMVDTSSPPQDGAIIVQERDGTIRRATWEERRKVHYKPVSKFARLPEDDPTVDKITYPYDEEEKALMKLQEIRDKRMALRARRNEQKKQGVPQKDMQALAVEEEKFEKEFGALEKSLRVPDWPYEYPYELDLERDEEGRPLQSSFHETMFSSRFDFVPDLGDSVSVRQLEEVREHFHKSRETAWKKAAGPNPPPLPSLREELAQFEKHGMGKQDLAQQYGISFRTLEFLFDEHITGAQYGAAQPTLFAIGGDDGSAPVPRLLDDEVPEGRTKEELLSLHERVLNDPILGGIAAAHRELQRHDEAFEDMFSDDQDGSDSASSSNAKHSDGSGETAG